jgi:hypothetical protein
MHLHRAAFAMVLGITLGAGLLPGPAQSAACAAHSARLAPSVHTSVTQSVSACVGGFSTCCYAGDMKATFAVTLNGDGTADVKTTLKLVKVKGPCGTLSGQVTETRTVAVGVPQGVQKTILHGIYLASSLSASFTVNEDGTVSGVGLGLYLYYIDP